VALAAVPFGLGIGLSLGMLGGGGSVLAVPILVYILGQDVHQATLAAGARLARRAPQRQLASGFAGLVVVAAYLLVSAALLGGPPGA
jgi:uncharacterized protein